MTAILISGTIFLPALLGVCLSMTDCKKTDSECCALPAEEMQEDQQ